MTLNNLPDLITKKELADYLRISMATLHRWINKGVIKLTVLRDGKKRTVRIRKQDVIDYLERLNG